MYLKLPPGQPVSCGRPRSWQVTPHWKTYWCVIGLLVSFLGYHVISLRTCHYYVGIMQGDCLGAVLFMFYLAKALSSRPPLGTEHCYSRPPQLACEPPLVDHTYAEHPGVAHLPQCDMGHSFIMRANMLVIPTHRQLKAKLIKPKPQCLDNCCLVFDMLVCTVYVNPTRWNCK